MDHSRQLRRNCFDVISPGAIEIAINDVCYIRSPKSVSGQGGFAGTILGLAAAVSDFGMDTISAAIDSTPTKKVWKWVSDKIGSSVYSKRKEFRKIARSQEQKSAEKLCAV